MFQLIKKITKQKIRLHFEYDRSNKTEWSYTFSNNVN